MENLEDICLDKLNKILSEFDLKVSIVRIKSISVCQYRLTYGNCNENWIGYWKSLSDMLIKKQDWTIFDCLQQYHGVSKHLKSSVLQYKNLSDAYNSIKCLQSDSLEEFMINCNLIGI